jgi:hypothetical protein
MGDLFKELIAPLFIPIFKNAAVAYPREAKCYLLSWVWSVKRFFLRLSARRARI